MTKPSDTSPENTPRFDESTLLDGLKTPGFLEKIIDAVADPVFVKDEDHRWIMLNQSLCDMMGHPREELLGKSDYDFFPKEEADVFWKKDEEAFASGETNVNEERFTDADGKTHVIVTKKSVFEDHEGNKILVGVITDMTEVKLAQEELKKARDELERKVEERTAEVKRTQELLFHAQKLDAMGKLAGGIAHDFNNLLAVMQSSLELIMLRCAADEQLEDLAAQALEAIASGTTLTQRMVAFSREQTLTPRPTHLPSLFKGAEVLLNRSLSADYNLEISFSSNELAASVDPVQLETAFIHLAINARDAMPDGGPIRVQIDHQDIDSPLMTSLGNLDPGPYVVITVQDEGFGMAPETQAKIFEPFFTTKPECPGLGLSMVYGFVKQSGGTIKVESEVDVGTTIALYLPRATGLYALAQSAKTQSVSAGPGVGRYVMVVEDEPTVRSMTTMFLQALGYSVYNASNAQDATEKLNKIGHIDVLLTDIALGRGQNGYQLAQELIHSRPGLRHIYMTGQTNEKLRDEVVKDSAPLLTKPFKLTHLEQTLNEVLRHSN